MNWIIDRVMDRRFEKLLRGIIAGTSGFVIDGFTNMTAYSWGYGQEI